MNIKFAVGGKIRQQDPACNCPSGLYVPIIDRKNPAKTRRKRYRGVKVMMGFINYLINGISLGSVYAIIALGYTMVYGELPKC